MADDGGGGGRVSKVSDYMLNLDSALEYLNSASEGLISQSGDRALAAAGVGKTCFARDDERLLDQFGFDCAIMSELISSLSSMENRMTATGKQIDFRLSGAAPQTVL